MNYSLFFTDPPFLVILQGNEKISKTRKGNKSSTSTVPFFFLKYSDMDWFYQEGVTFGRIQDPSSNKNFTQVGKKNPSSSAYC